MRKLTALEALLSLWQFGKEHIGTVLLLLFGPGGVALLAWRYIELVAFNVGWWFYPFILAVFFLAALGILGLALFLRGDIGVRRIMIAQLRTMEAEEFAKLKEKYARVVTDTAIFMADQKNTEPTHNLGDITDQTDARRQWGETQQKHMQHRNEWEAKFYERFTPRLIDLMVDLKKAGASDRVTRRPVWSIFTWWDSSLQEIGSELERLEKIYELEKTK